MELQEAGVETSDHLGKRCYYNVITDSGHVEYPLAAFRYTASHVGGALGARLTEPAAYYVAPAAGTNAAIIAAVQERRECAVCANSSTKGLLSLHGQQWHSQCHVLHCSQCYRTSFAGQPTPTAHVVNAHRRTKATSNAKRLRSDQEQSAMVENTS